MNTIALALTALWMHGPFHQLASTDSNNLCVGAGLCSVDSKGNVVGNDPSALSSPLTGSVKSIIEILLTVAGAVAVLIIVIAGLRYITSAGDAARVKQSKDTLLYAIVGLVIAILAYAVVAYVTSNIK
jgi:type IV secretory pathway VirB2 component (pilin)